MSEQSSRKWLYVIVGVALLFRWGTAVALQYKLDQSKREFLIAGDAEGYWLLAHTIAYSEDYAVHQPPRYVHRMPGFPAVLAASISLFGSSFLAARLLLATIGGLTCILVYQLGKRVFSENIGLLAAALFAISPSAIGFSGLILSETLFGTTMLLSLLALHSLYGCIEDQDIRDAGDSPQPLKHRLLSVQLIWQSILSGCAFALGVYVKPSWILVAPLTLLLLPFLAKKRITGFITGLLVLLSMVLCLLPWGLRNQQVTGHFKLTTFWMGPSLYDGLNPHTTGESDMQFFDDDQLATQLNEYEIDKEYQRRALKFAAENPMKTIQLAVNKAVRYWKPWPNAAQFNSWILKLALGVYTIPLFLLAIYAAWVNRRKFWSLLILAGPIFYFAALHMVFVSSLRYRLPAEAPLAVLAAVGLVSLVEKRETFHPSGE